MLAQKFPRGNAKNVAGHKQEFGSQKGPRFGERAIEVLAIEARHLHIANDEQVVAIERGNKRAPRVVQDLAGITEIGEHVRDQLGDRGFVLDNQHATSARNGSSG